MAARDEARQNYDRWLRERADLENLKRRADRERAETVKFANERLLKDLLPVVDNLQRVVFVKTGDTVKQVKVDTGVQDTTHIEIKSGLKAGEATRPRFGISTVRVSGEI